MRGPDGPPTSPARAGWGWNGRRARLHGRNARTSEAERYFRVFFARVMVEHTKGARRPCKTRPDQTKPHFDDVNLFVSLAAALVSSTIASDNSATSSNARTVSLREQIPTVRRILDAGKIGSHAFQHFSPLSHGIRANLDSKNREQFETPKTVIFFRHRRDRVLRIEKMREKAR